MSEGVKCEDCGNCQLRPADDPEEDEWICEEGLVKRGRVLEPDRRSPGTMRVHHGLTRLRECAFYVSRAGGRPACPADSSPGHTAAPTVCAAPRWSDGREPPSPR
jgi:hypothetical protein